jgi:threonine/homoserine/homoserine lactone efflux protein
MLWSAIGDLLPAAAAVALSPFPIVAVVVVLGTARARANGLAFAAGWTGGLAVLTAIATVITSGASDPDSAPSTAVGVGRVLMGLALFGLAGKTWHHRPRPGEEAPMPGWMATLDDAAPGRTVVLGAALSGLNPKIMALTISGAASISQAGLDATESALAAAAFVAIGSSTVLIAVGAHLLAPERAAGPLATLKRFMIDNNTAIMLVVLVVLGANILGEGIANLTA